MRRRNQVDREARVGGLLNRGNCVAKITDWECVSLMRMRNCVRELLERRARQPPAGTRRGMVLLDTNGMS
ncbi:hypothetical protein DFR50_15125 [Roseiarcus fermentans]|uniref:Uncharacterized protein n=1 Tax=Roseiarcus fermentans TaxID=1473586 RepID=A0A366EM40_9HYPH|nr:hypothetical protein DFR50_15125 [Roseiarcus fermentans]